MLNPDRIPVLDKLEYLMALAREQHFGRAAEACGVTQPTLSAGIKQLEEQLGVLLVQRGSRFKGFTPEGERVLDWARRIVGDTRAMREEINALRHGLTGQLRIAAIPTALAMVADSPRLTARAIPTCASPSVAHLDRDPRAAGESRDRCRPHLPRQRAARPRQRVPLYQERYQLLTAADAPLGNRERVTWAEVAQVPLCLLTPDMQNRRIIDGLLRAPAAMCSRRSRSDSMILLFAHVRTGRWASVMPARLAETLGPHRHDPRDPDRRARRRCTPSAWWCRRASR